VQLFVPSPAFVNHRRAALEKMIHSYPFEAVTSWLPESPWVTHNESKRVWCKQVEKGTCCHREITGSIVLRLDGVKDLSPRRRLDVVGSWIQRERGPC